MDKTVLKAAEIRYLWKNRGSKNYELKCLKATGNFIKSIIFEDVLNVREVSGKLVTSPREGEAYHWPRLQHENLAPLFDVVSISEKVSVYMSIVLEKSLRDIIHEEEFLQAPNSFERKKSYSEDVLWGLDYLHSKRLCLMNLNDANVFIHIQTDKAVITDFSCLTLAARAMKCNVVVPSQYRAPELNNSSTNFDAVAAEMWACGVMLFQIFTGHAIPEACCTEEAVERIGNFHYDVFVEVNKGLFISSNVFISLQRFLSMFLCLQPSERCSAKMAAISSFLQSGRKTDRRYGKLWELYVPRVFSSSEENECENPSFCEPPKMFSDSHSNEVDSYRDKLKIYFPWNKFVNLNYVSSEDDNSEKDMLRKSPQSTKQQNNKVLNKEQLKQENSLNFGKVSTNDYFLKTNKTANQPLESHASETTKNDSYCETNAPIKKLKTPMDLSCLCCNLVNQFRNNEIVPSKEISTTDFKQTEIQKSEVATSMNDINNTPSENIIEMEMNDIKKTNEPISPKEFPIGDCIGVFQKEAKETETSFINNDGSITNVTSAIENTHVNYIEGVQTTNKLFPSSSFSTGDSIGVVGSENKCGNKQVNYSWLSESKKNHSDSDDCSECYEDLEIEQANKIVEETNWIKEEQNQHSSLNVEKNQKTKPSSLLNTKISKLPRFSFNKNRSSELLGSLSESTANSSISFSSKSDPGMNQYYSNLFNRSSDSHKTLSSDACDSFLINSTEKEFKRMDYIKKDDKSINEEVGIKPFSFSKESSFFHSSGMDRSDVLQKSADSEIDNSLSDCINRSLTEGLLLSARTLSYHPFFSYDNNVRQSLLESKTSPKERNPPFSAYCKSEMCLDVKIEAETSGSTIEQDSIISPKKCMKSATTKIDYKLESNNTRGLETRMGIYKCNKNNSNESATIESLNKKSKECFLSRDNRRRDDTIEKQPIPLAAESNKTVVEENRKPDDIIQEIEDISVKFNNVENEQAVENSNISLELDMDEGMKELLASSFTEISLNSTKEPTSKREKNKIKKKVRHKKSWFHRLCPGCKVYYDDKEELFAGTI